MSDRAGMIARAEHDGRVFEIVADLPEVGFYLNVYEGGQCTHDYLQDTIEMCKLFAQKDLGVPLSAWTNEN